MSDGDQPVHDGDLALIRAANFTEPTHRLLAEWVAWFMEQDGCEDAPPYNLVIRSAVHLATERGLEKGIL